MLVQMQKDMALVLSTEGREGRKKESGGRGKGKGREEWRRFTGSTERALGKQVRSRARSTHCTTFEEH